MSLVAFSFNFLPLSCLACSEMVDLCVVLDAGGRTSTSDWEMMRTFTADIVRAFTVSHHSKHLLLSFTVKSNQFQLKKLKKIKFSIVLTN